MVVVAGLVEAATAAVEPVVVAGVVVVAAVVAGDAVVIVVDDELAGVVMVPLLPLLFVDCAESAALTNASRAAKRRVDFMEK